MPVLEGEVRDILDAFFGARKSWGGGLRCVFEGASDGGLVISDWEHVVTNLICQS